MKRFIVGLLTVAMLVTLIPVAAFATETEERLVYQSSTNFSIETGDGTWDDGIWAATLVDLSGANPMYSTVTTTDDSERFISEHGTYVDADEIAPVTQNANKDNYAIYGAAKTFTAPKSGNITISYADVANGENVGAVVKYAWNQGMKFRITKQSGSNAATKIYPADAEYLENKTNNGTIIVVESGVTTKTTVNEGDKIHFEVMRMDNKNPWQGVYCDPIITYTTEEEGGGNGGETDDNEGETPVVPEDKTVFQSSENFSTESGDGTWDDVWSASMLNFNTNVYTILSADGNAWKSNNVAIDNTHMIPYIGNKANVSANNHIGVAKTFTAPKDGYVKIYFATVKNPYNNTDYGISVHQANRQMSFRIRHQSGTEVTKIYPITGDFLESRLNDYTSFEMLEADKVVNTIEIKQGDKIHFEVKKTLANEEDNWNGIHCDPVVEYIDESEIPDDPLASDPADKKVYKSSENFSDIQNGDYAWKWQYYDINKKEYKNLTSVSQMAGFGLDAEEKATIWYLPQNTQFNKDRGISVGAVGMRVSIDEPNNVATDGEKAGEIERNYPVKSFTAPKRGEVTISADVFEPGHTSGGAALRIIKHSAGGTQTKLYPADADWINIYPGDTFTAIKTVLEKGDVLTFENALWKANSAWQAIIRWDPVITYTKLIPVVDDCNTEIGATDVPLNKEHVITYSGDIAAPSASEIKIYEIAPDGTKTESNAKPKSIVADGNDLKLVFDGLKPYTEYEIEVGGVGFTSTPNDTAANTLTFTTGPVVMIGEAEYANGKVTIDVNNSADAPSKATLAVFLCKGTETEYTVENVRIVTRTDIGANDSMEAAITLPSGNYFIKAMVLEDALTARAYAPMTILKGEN